MNSKKHAPVKPAELQTSSHQTEKIVVIGVSKTNMRTRLQELSSHPQCKSIPRLRTILRKNLFLDAPRKKLTSLQKFSEIFRMHHHLDRRSSQDLLEGTPCYMWEENIRISNWKLPYVAWLCITVPDARILIPPFLENMENMIRDMNILHGTGGYAK